MIFEDIFASVYVFFMTMLGPLVVGYVAGRWLSVYVRLGLMAMILLVCYAAVRGTAHGLGYFTYGLFLYSAFLALGHWQKTKAEKNTLRISVV